jgi:hypothetical protein
MRLPKDAVLLRIFIGLVTLEKVQVLRYGDRPP